MATRIVSLMLLVALHCSGVAESLAQSKKNTTIIFVCEHGGARSTIASVYFNKMAKNNNLPYYSIFRALTPDTSISKETKNGLIRDGFETTTLFPVALSSNDISSNTLLITLDCTVPSSFHTDKTWSGIPAISEDYKAARNAILKRLDELIIELKNKELVSHQK